MTKKNNELPAPDSTGTDLAVIDYSEPAPDEPDEEEFFSDFFEDTAEGEVLVAPLDYQFTARLKGPPSYKDIKDGLVAVEITFVRHCASADVVEVSAPFLEMFAQNDPGVTYGVTAAPSVKQHRLAGL